MLSKFINTKREDWDLFVPCVAFCYNTTINEVTESTGSIPRSLRSNVAILEADGPTSIENFKQSNQYEGLEELRRTKKPLPTMPLKEQAVGDEKNAYVHDLVFDNDGTAPVLYRIKYLFGSGAKLDSVHFEVQFRIPIKKKTGWAVGHAIRGAYEADFLDGQISNIQMGNGFLTVTAKLTTSSGWTSARDVEIKGINSPERTCITVNVAGTPVHINDQQVSAANMFNKNYPLLVVDSAYGAGKSLCTAGMAQEAVRKGEKILVAAVQNSAPDVIGSKIAQLQSDQIRPVRYVCQRPHGKRPVEYVAVCTAGVDGKFPRNASSSAFRPSVQQVQELLRQQERDARRTSTAPGYCIRRAHSSSDEAVRSTLGTTTSSPTSFYPLRLLVEHSLPSSPGPSYHTSLLSPAATYSTQRLLDAQLRLECYR
ncbi:hypothetical protein Y032_0092g2570 [Ancylostoma ceylanicum]|uniref:Uncharacterized protein n=1 Tax=Ancylostoma ceylanicum TaxID=53326 RepID=A0A016TME6_9BILA|nr:hypothetical protein Y032_0092g2570 [Ancylostoma ceylanicum]